MKILSEQAASIKANFKSGFLLVLPQVPVGEGCVSSGSDSLNRRAFQVAYLYVVIL